MTIKLSLTVCVTANSGGSESEDFEFPRKCAAVAQGELAAAELRVTASRPRRNGQQPPEDRPASRLALTSSWLPDPTPPAPDLHVREIYIQKV